MSVAEDVKALKLIAHNKAQAMWVGFTDQEKKLVRFGMFPAEKMRAATDEGHDSHLLSVELMNCAQRDGGMVS